MTLAAGVQKLRAGVRVHAATVMTSIGVYAGLEAEAASDENASRIADIDRTNSASGKSRSAAAICAPVESTSLVNSAGNDRGG